ncbi:MAG: FHA domain-containing protein, partial [Thermoguttaceae bacterium]
MGTRAARQRFFLWIDGVGGYWVCRGETVSLGSVGECRDEADVPILSDLARRHALLRRDDEGFLIEAFQKVAVGDRPVDGAAWLRDGCRIRLGRSVQLLFRRPHALSATARLEFVSPHRTQPSTDAVLWMADSCVLGPKSHSHVVCRRWT